MCNESHRFITSERVEGKERVCDLVDFGTMEWDVNLVHEEFNEQDAGANLSISLSERLPEDSITWAFTKNGMYTYMVGKSKNLELFHKVWVKIWSLPITPKVRHFMWRLCSSSLSVRNLLKYMQIVEDACGPLCSTVPEISSHAIFHCPTVHEACEVARLASLVPNDEFSCWLGLWNEW